jgi:cytochrome c oxidase cbb3-type subunit I/II
MDYPPSTTPGSVMPAYTHLMTDDFDASDIEAKMRALRRVGVPYTDADIDGARAAIAAQAAEIAADVAANRGPKDLEAKEITALTAYLQRLGTDIQWRPPLEEEIAAAGGAP